LKRPRGCRGSGSWLQEAPQEVVGIFGGFDIGEEVGEEVARQEVDVLGEEGDEGLEGEALGEGAIAGANGDFVEDGGEAVAAWRVTSTRLFWKTGRSWVGKRKARGRSVGGRSARVSLVEGFIEVDV